MGEDIISRLNSQEKILLLIGFGLTGHKEILLMNHLMT